jgi:hypothetical protein
MSNPLIDDLDESGVIPQIEIALPTLAAFYPTGEVLRDFADPYRITVSALSVLDESAFRDPLMLLSGHAVGKMIHRVCRAVNDSGRLADLDVQAILIACRMASYGSDMKLEHSCSQCKTKNTLSVDLNEHIIRFGSFTPEQFERFDLDIPTIGQKVRLQPMVYQDAVDMTMTMVRSNITAEMFDETNKDNPNQLTDEFIDMYRKQFDANISTNIESICASIFAITTKSGKIVSNRDMIREWLLAVSTDVVKMITDRIGEINHDIRERSRLEYNCMECDHVNTFYMELDPQKLFTPAEVSEPKTKSSAESKTTGKPTKKPSRVSRK